MGIPSETVSKIHLVDLAGRLVLQRHVSPLLSPLTPSIHSCSFH